MHRLLERQIRKATMDGRLDLDMLLTLVDSAYHEADRERVRVDRATSLMSEELLELNRAVHEEAARQFRAIVDNVYEAILIVDDEGRIVTLNAAAAALFGHGAAELRIGALMPCVAAYGDAQQCPFLCSAIDQQENRPCRIMARRADGSEFPAEASFSALIGENSRRYVFVVRDESERLRTERELQAARDEAEQANRVKSQFLASMCHELRTPLNAILGFSDAIMAEMLGPVMPAAYADYIRSIHEGGARLLALVDQLLDLAKVEAGRMELVPEVFAVERMLQAVTRATEMLARRNGNAFSLQVDNDLGKMTADELRVSQILLNLLGNACKFTQDGSVCLSVRRIGEWLEFRVADTGIGIRPEQLGRLFDDFHQADATVAKRFGGSGLGLSISRHLCRMMGGSISIDSTPGQGSTFTLRLPACSAQPATGAEAPDLVALAG